VPAYISAEAAFSFLGVGIKPPTPTLGNILANSVNYKSASWGGFDLLAAYSAGEKNPGPSGDLKGIGAEFKQSGLYLGAAYHTVKRLSSGDDKEYGAGVAYTFADVGGLEIKANYLSACGPTYRASKRSKRRWPLFVRARSASGVIK